MTGRLPQKFIASLNRRKADASAVRECVINSVSESNVSDRVTRVSAIAETKVITRHDC